MCYPCRCPRRSISCHGGRACCPRPCCHQRSCSTGNSRVVFPEEFQKFSDMIPPSFLVTEPKCRNVKKKSNGAAQASKVVKDSDCGDKGQKSTLCDPEEARCPEEPGFPGEAGFPRGPGTGLVDCCQPTDTPWYETNCMPSQPQWVDYGCPGPVCCPINPQGFNTGLRAAGLPSKRSPPFNPCTGQVCQCANPQMVGGNPNQMGQTYNQICQGVNICFSPANTCLQFTPCNFGEGANLNEAIQNPTYYQFCQCANMGPGPENPSPEDTSSLSPQGDNRSKDHRKGKERRDENVAKATKSSQGQRHQYNQDNCEEDGNLNEGNREQAYYQYGQEVNMGVGPANPYYLNNGGDGTQGPSPGHPRSAPQGDSRSKDHRKRKESREGNVAKSTKSRDGAMASQRPQYNEEDVNSNEANPYQAYYQYCQDVNMGPNSANPYYLYNGGDGTLSPSSQHPRSAPQPDNRSKGQRKVAKATNASQRHHYNQDNCEEEGNLNAPNRGQYMDPRQVRQHPIYSDQGGKRLAYQENRNETREAPRSNHHNRYNSQDCREETIDRRRNSQAQQSGRVSHQNSTAGHVYQTKRSELRDASRPTHHNSRKESIDPRKSSHRSKSLEPRNEPRREKSARKPQPSRSGTISSDRAPRADARSRSLGKQNESRDHPSKNKPETNLSFYKQNVGMSFGPSNEHYIANYTPPDPIYTTTLESTLCDSGSPRERNKSKRVNTTRNYGQARQENLPGNQPTGGAPYNLRFDPTIQYSNECYSPPSPEKLRTTREKTHNLPSNDRSQLLNRTRETGQFYNKQMPKETSKQQPACMCKPTLSEILANEISSQPHVLLLKKRVNGQKKSPEEQQDSENVLVLKKQMNGQKKSPAEQQGSELQEKCSCDYQEDDCSGEEPDNCSDTEKPVNCPCTEKPISCPCTEEANYCKKNAGVDAAISAGCTNRCGWMTCPNPWPCCCGRFNGPCNSSFIGPCKSSFIHPCNSTFFGPCNSPFNGPCNRPLSGPCNGRLCYYGTCYNGCGNCCNYRCNPCGGCFCQPSANPAKPVPKDSGKSKEKQEGKRTFHSRRLGGTDGNNPRYSSLRPPSTFGNFIPAHPTMQGYFPTAPPQYISPYSGHWQAGEVLLKPMFSNQNTLDS